MSGTTGNAGNSGNEPTGGTQTDKGTPPETNNNGAGDDDKGTPTPPMSTEALERYISERVAKATEAFNKEKSGLEKIIAQMKKEKMTDEQIREQERKDREKEIADREKAIKAKENKLFALEQIKTLGLDKGGVAALELADLVIADTDEEMTKRAKTLDTLVKALVKEQVDKTFKTNGRNPSGGDGGADKEKPENSLAKKLGEQAAERNKQAKTVLDYYK